MVDMMSAKKGSKIKRERSDLIWINRYSFKFIYAHFHKNPYYYYYNELQVQKKRNQAHFSHHRFFVHTLLGLTCLLLPTTVKIKRRQEEAARRRSE